MKTTYKLILLVLLASLCSIAIYYRVEKVKPVTEKKHIIESQNKFEKVFSMVNILLIIQRLF